MGQSTSFNPACIARSLIALIFRRALRPRPFYRHRTKDIFRPYTLSLLSELMPDKVRQISADLAAERKLAVRECTRTGKARSDIAVGLTVYAFTRLGFGTMPLFHGQAFFNDHYFFFEPFFSISRAVKIPEGPAPMINTSVFKLLIPLHKKTVNTDLRFSAIYGNQLLLITYYISTTQP